MCAARAAPTSLRWEGQCRSAAAGTPWSRRRSSAGARPSKRARRTRRRAASDAARAPIPTHDTDRHACRHARDRPRARRRHRPGLAGPARRRAGHRQVDARAGAVRRTRARRRDRPRPVRVGRGIGRPAPAARHAPRPGRRAAPPATAIDVLAETSVERIVAAAEATAPGAAGRRLDPDADHRRPRGPAGSVGQVRSAAARLQALAKEHGRAGHPGRPRDQGRHARRAQDARAHRRRGADARGRALLRPAPAAREQEPLRLDRGGGRLRDGRRGPDRGRRSGRGVHRDRIRSARRASPWRPRSRAAGRCWSRSRRSSRRRSTARRGGRLPDSTPSA